ncbi:hypothetical protein M422DRAFT_247120 [Sphaerobolus stellatus SS14]|nr:hypothetical protein M422DRAFT_247120 [Sphaerobolus stellatus SS14]
MTTEITINEIPTDTQRAGDMSPHLPAKSKMTARSNLPSEPLNQQPRLIAIQQRYSYQRQASLIYNDAAYNQLKHIFRLLMFGRTLFTISALMCAQASLIVALISTLILLIYQNTCFNKFTTAFLGLPPNPRVIPRKKAHSRSKLKTISIRGVKARSVIMRTLLTLLP